MTRRIAVVGAGMAAARFAERFRLLGGDAEVTLYGAEPCAPYNRVLLADALTGRYATDDLTSDLALDLTLPSGDARLRTDCAVTGLDTVAHTLRLADGEQVPYDELVLATGAEPVLPPVDGLCGPGGRPRPGVHVLRTAADCRGLAGAAAHARRAVVIGGGVLGVSAARALAARGLPVTLVHRAGHLVERDLDGAAGEILRRGLAELGVEVRTGSVAREVRAGTPVGAGRTGFPPPSAFPSTAPSAVAAVRLADDHVLDADLVVAACGVAPRTALARTAGLPVRTGVVVDDRLSCAPDAYAIGDCAEHRGTVHGTAVAAWDQADVLAARLSGAAPDAVYRGSRPYTRLTAGPLAYAAFGETGPEDPGPGTPGVDVLRLADATRGSYKKLLLRGDRIVGGILLGDPAAAAALIRAYERDEPVVTDPLYLLTAQGAC
ncbi:NAD(P)/FAD-dependent oxidoreductase [Streptomyces hiroshimensis]|uniref:Nitrite reductase n=1 Tax=Streptomyces hiroshimensis TaxID=66424 RepID=A0ABQ2YS35_9ACTN|nr:FAD-dependent oxidoreductase [Streptomyces hiroshimensis]GGX93459.1 nitrite reductase [Streptomyces hiroshimensis]